MLVNVETQNFELVRDDKGNQFNLLKSISAQQLLNAAGRDFVLQRTVQFSNYVINSPATSVVPSRLSIVLTTRCTATPTRDYGRCRRKAASGF